MADRVSERAAVSVDELSETVIGGMHTRRAKRASTSASHSPGLVL